MDKYSETMFDTSTLCAKDKQKLCAYISDNYKGQLFCNCQKTVYKKGQWCAYWVYIDAFKRFLILRKKRL